MADTFCVSDSKEQFEIFHELLKLVTSSVKIYKYIEEQCSFAFSECASAQVFFFFTSVYQKPTLRIIKIGKYLCKLEMNQS